MTKRATFSPEIPVITGTPDSDEYAVPVQIVGGGSSAGVEVNVNDGSGNGIDSTTNLAVQRGLNTVSQGTIFDFSTVNSSTVQLAASATFTGTIESVLNQQAYSLLFFSDQNATITVNQFIDAAGAKLIQQSVYTYTASGGFARSGVMNGNYFQVTVQNTGGSTTTTLRLDTAYGTIPAATQLNNGPVAINEIGGTALTPGQKAAAASIPVTLSNENVQDLFFTGQAAQTATVNNIIPAAVSASATDATGYRSAAIQIVSTGTGGTFIFEQSNDNSNFQTMTVYNSTILTGTPITAAITPTASQFIYVFPVAARYVRVRIATTITGGTIQAVTKLSQAAFSSSVIQVAQATTGNLNATVTATNLSTNVAQIGGTTTVNGGVAGILAVGGNVAHSGTSTSNPLQIGGRVVPSTAATVDTTLVATDVSYLPISTGLQTIVKPFATSELDYVFNMSSVGTVVTLQQIVPASGTALVRNYLTSLTIQSDTLGAAGNAWILDGQGAIGTSVTIATPGVFTSSAHDLKVGDTIVFTSLGTITGISTNTVYYITATSFAATTFTIATTQGGTALQITGSTSAFTFYRVLYPIRFQTTAINAPTQITFPNPPKGIANSAMNLLIPVSLTSGSIYLTVSGFRGF